MEIEKELSARGVGSASTDDNTMKTAAKQNAAILQSENPGVNVVEIFDAIVSDPVLDPLFASYGVGPLQLVSTPERARASFELAKLVHKAKNFDAAVKAAVKKEMGAKAKAKSASNPGTGNRTTSAKNENSEYQEFVELSGDGIF